MVAVAFADAVHLFSLLGLTGIFHFLQLALTFLYCGFTRSFGAFFLILELVLIGLDFTTLDKVPPTSYQGYFRVYQIFCFCPNLIGF